VAGHGVPGFSWAKTDSTASAINSVAVKEIF